MTQNLSVDLDALLHPRERYVPTILARDPSLIPKAGGIYGWWFDRQLPVVPRDEVLNSDGWALLYVGIAPSGAARTSGKRTLRDRLKNHCKGPIRTSTLRRTVTALVGEELGLEVTRDERGKVAMPRDDEDKLSQWLGEHARLSWLVHDQPWIVETQLIRSGPRLPLNVSQSSDPFRPHLAALRAQLGR